MSVKNRELSQFGQFLNIDDSNSKVGIATTTLPFVGIGTTNPTAKFFVNGNAIITGILTAGGIRGAGGQIGFSSASSYVGLITQFNFIGAGVTIITQYESTSGIATVTFTGGNGSSPGGSESQVQYFSGGTFAGSNNFRFNGTDVAIAGVATASRFISTVAQGTSPISVASSTIVTNFNADYLKGYNPQISNINSSIVLRDIGGNFQAGIITALSFVGSHSGSITDQSGTSRLDTLYGTNVYYANAFFNTGIITSITNTNATLNRVNISGIVTVANNPVLIGIAASTGTQAQRLQVEGKGYFSDSLGVGNTNPSSRLTVVGDTSISGVATANAFSGEVRASLLSVTGITTLSNVSAGIITCTDINSTSDLIFKKDITTIENALERLLKVRGVSFTWKETNLPAMGVIAQELEQVLPDLVSLNEHKSVNYNGLIGLLIEAVKELTAEVERLKDRS